MSTAPNRLRTPIPALRAYAGAAALLPGLALADDRSTSAVISVVVGVMIAVGAAAVVARARPPASGWIAGLAGLVVAVAGWLLPQADPSPITWLLSVAIGLAVGLAAGVPGWGPVVLARWAVPCAAAAGVVQLVVLGAIDGGHAAAPCGVLFGTAMLVAGVLDHGRQVRAPRRMTRALAGSIAVLTIGVGCWIGANSPTATWFGSQVSHGPRDRDRVAITFDDGPNVRYSTRIARILDEHGAKGTFFLVGKALDARPGVARQLMRDGHLLGNHSYHHDSWRWLDPRYPELERTQRAFRRNLGVCPTFYRAPHGQHTPFTAHVVGDHDMTMVGWDVSAGDWNSSDAALVAERVLDQVGPGSIIVLHDGLDGDLTADRSVLLRALPMILDGLERRGLDPVSLDELLGEHGYGDHC